MRVFSIPEDLEIDVSSSVQIVNYKNFREETLRQQVKLTRNTFSFLLEGEKGVITRDDNIVISNSQFLLMKSSHCLMTETVSTIHKSYRSVLLFFTDEFLHDFFRKHFFSIHEENKTKAFQVFEYDSYIQNFVRDLEEVSAFTSALQSQLLPIKLEEILLYLVGTQGSQVLAPFLTKPDQLSNHLNVVVQNNKYKKLSLQELAFLCNMSLSTFKREFEKQYNESPIKWFQNQRLEYASYLLHEKQQRPTEVYLEVGYESLSSFIQAYKARFGKTPKQHQID